MSKITITCNKCQATATVASVKAMKDWNDLHEYEHSGAIMGRIVSPDCRDKNHGKCPGDAWDEGHDHPAACQCACHGGAAAGPQIRVWETEDAMLVIWGTHDPNAAYGAAVDWYEANSEVPDGLANEILDVAVTGAGEHWGDPAVLDSDEAPWPAHLISRKHVEGWTPYMVVCW